MTDGTWGQLWRLLPSCPLLLTNMTTSHYLGGIFSWETPFLRVPYSICRGALELGQIPNQKQKPPAMQFMLSGLGVRTETEGLGEKSEFSSFLPSVYKDLGQLKRGLVL